jgi:hypothetical protein
MVWERSLETDQAPSGRQRHSACLVRSRIYIYGGFDGFKWLDDAHILDIHSIEEHALRTSMQAQIAGNLRCLFMEQNPTHSDITFIVHDTPLYAHKSMLLSQSDHFRRMFGSGMKESRDNTIVVQDWSVTAFSQFLVPDTHRCENDTQTLSRDCGRRKINVT